MWWIIPYTSSLKILLSKIYRTQNEKQFCTGDQISSTLYYGVKKGCTVCVWYAMSVFIYINEGKIDGILHSILWENYSFLHLSAKACKRKEWESRAISRWMCGFGPPFFHFFFFPPPLVRRPYTTADISESYQTTKPLRFRDAILIIYKHEN